MDYSLIDTHAHLTFDRLYQRVDEIVEHALDAGFNKIVCICTSIEEFDRALIIQKKYPKLLDIALGFHPSDLFDISEADHERLEQACKQHEIVAIGEIGLDYHYEGTDIEMQKELFIRQMKLANTYDYPILIHMRDATKDTLELIEEHCKTKFLMHCFSGSKETAKVVVTMGGYISFAGPLTFKNARGLLEVPAVVPMNKMFIETDCPFLTPHPFRGKENEPMYASYTFAKLVELLGVDAKQLADQMQENYKRFFKL